MTNRIVFIQNCPQLLGALSPVESETMPPPDARPPPLAPGTRLGHFEILELIGRGGMGVVYKARDLRLDRLVAIKVLGSKLLPDETARRRFLREAQLAASVAHPAVATIHEIDEDAGHTFIAMEYVPGRTLRDVLRAGPLPADEVARIGLRIAEALEAAHERGIVHRDVKSSNVILTRGGDVKVLDFGLAKAISGSEPDEATTSRAAAAGPDETASRQTGGPGITGHGVALGTPSYMAPEQALGEGVDHRADLFSLGVVLYEAACGDLPFRGRTERELVTAIAEAVPVPPHERRSAVPRPLSGVILRLLAKSPEARFADATAAAAALRCAVPRTRARLPALLRRHPRRAVAAAAGVALLAAVVALLATRRPAAPPPRWSAPATVAVLPAAPLGPPEDRLLAAGLTEALVARLTRHRGLRVTSRGATARFGDADPKEVGRALGVDAVVETSVQHAGDTVRVTARLVDARDGSEVWTARYEWAEPADLLALQDAASVRLAAALAFRLGVAGAGPARLAGMTQDPDAYRLYVEGRSRYYEYTRAGNDASIALFERALARDPSFALAHAGIALAYLQYSNSAWDLSPRWIALAAEHAERALALDADLAEPSFALGFVRFQRGDVVAARERFEHAVAINPSHAHAHAFLGAIDYQVDGNLRRGAEEYDAALLVDPMLLVALWHRSHLAALAGRFDEAMAFLRRAQALRPNGPYTWLYTGALHTYRGDLAAAARAAERMVALAPDGPFVRAAAGLLHEMRGENDAALEDYGAALEGHEGVFLALAGRARVLRHAGRAAEALDACERALRASPDPRTSIWASPASVRATRIVLLRETGRIEEAERELGGLLEERARAATPLAAYDAARALALAGDVAGALERLDEAVRRGFDARALFRVEPDLAALRGDPRFERLVGPAAEPR